MFIVEIKEVRSEEYTRVTTHERVEDALELASLWRNILHDRELTSHVVRVLEWNGSDVAEVS